MNKTRRRWKRKDWIDEPCDGSVGFDVEECLIILGGSIVGVVIAWAFVTLVFCI